MRMSRAFASATTIIHTIGLKKKHKQDEPVAPVLPVLPVFPIGPLLPVSPGPPRGPSNTTTTTPFISYCQSGAVLWEYENGGQWRAMLADGL